MAQIIPAILEENIDRFNTKVAAILAIPSVHRIQVDFSDGEFTPRKTVMPDDIDILNPAYKWEAHLMVKEPQQYFFDLQMAGFNHAIVHLEAVGAGSVPGIAAELKKMNMTCGVAINPDTNVDLALQICDQVESILVMGVQPGYQGQVLLPEAQEKVKKLRNASKNVIIEVDGGLKIDNISDLVTAGADRLVEGSALFDPGTEELTPTQNFERLSAKAG